MATITPDPEPGTERLRRPPPERTGPIRNMTSMLRGKSAGARAPAPGASSEEPPLGPEARAVRSGYELCEAAIRKGQEAARRFAPGLGDPRGAEGQGARDALGLAEGAFHVWADLVTAWMRAVIPLAPQGLPDPLKLIDALRVAISSQAPGQAPGQASGHVSGERGRATGHALSMAIDVRSSRPVRISIDMSRDVDPSELAVLPLQPLDRDPGKPAILGIELRPRQGSGGPALEIHLVVPDAQPPGRYLGAVHEKTSGAFVGGLTVDLGT